MLQKNIFRKKYPLLVFFLMIIAFLLFFFFPKQEDYTPYEKPVLHYPQGYVGSQTCKECHPTQYSEWLESHHFKAMQHANNQTILGDFNNITYTADGVTSRFFKKDDKFYINTQDSDGSYKDFQVIFTFGFYPLQQYLTEFEGGRMQVFRQSWDSKQGKWFHQYAGQTIDPDDYLHWTRSGQNWNMMCASCHSTDLRKNYDAFTDTYNTTYSELTVGCESCHGQGKSHTEFMRSGDYHHGTSKQMHILLGKNTSQTEELNQCMPCHSRRGEVTQHHTFSTEIMDNYIPEIPVTDLYFADGQVLDENYKYGSFLQSKMFHSQIKCSTCHSPHSGKLKAESNQLCLQCHDKSYGTTQHTFHKENTPASDCRSCHMPTRTYMGNDVRHDHNFYVPRPDLSAKYLTPNACNDCHSDKKPQWATQAINQWYGDKRKPHFAENLILGSHQTPQSIPHLDALLSNKSTPDIVRAAAVFYLGGIYTAEGLDKIKTQIHHTDPQVRYRTLIALANFPIDSYIEEVIPLLSDKVKAVRMVAANLFLLQKGLHWSKQHLPSFESARKEYETFVLSQADFPLGSATAGDYFSMIEQTDTAILFYERAIDKDKTLNHIRLNLATLYSGKQQNSKSWQILKEALRYEPKNPQIFYFMGLLYAEEKKYQQAKNHLERAINLGLEDPNLRRNYASIIELLKSTSQQK